MKCEDVRVLLAAYRRSEWTIEDQRAINKHLATCADCRHWEVEARRVGEQLRQLPTITPPPSLRERVFAAIKEEQLAATPAAPQPMLVAATERKATEPTPITAAKSASIPPVRATRPTTITIERIGEVGGSRHAPRVLFGRQTAIATVAALFVIVFAIRFLPSTNTGQIHPPQDCVSVQCQSSQGQHSFPPDATYATVTSALAYKNEAVYVGKSGDGKEMLFVSSFSNKQSTPLLSAPTSNSLAVVALTSKMVMWAEGDMRDAKNSWSLYALPVVNGNVQTASPQPIPLAERSTYLQGDTSAISTVNYLWANGQSAVLVLTTQDGRTLLVRADLSDGGIAFTDTTLARAQPGHTFIDPYIDGDSVFWVDTTIAAGGQPQHTIWRQPDQQNAPPQMISSSNSDAFGPVANGQNVAWVQTNANVSSVNSVGGTVTATVNIVASNGSGTPQIVSAAPIPITSVMRGDGYIFWMDRNGGGHIYSPGAGGPTSLAGSIPQNSQILGLSANAIVYSNPGTTVISVTEVQ